MNKAQPALVLAFKAVALAMAVACIVLTALGGRPVELYVILLSVGLFALTIGTIIPSR